eukprot:TRINITY_DN84731_c0_g1_i2.p1 TRINITY_DN84731_c0_g1~~TRINITY_DN84731_c0_g1_i2.p1  ORF type:complete len:482 (+),score=149.95 TRINITY_DN84731_c0_g1_i2:34-1479(+)
MLSRLLKFKGVLRHYSLNIGALGEFETSIASLCATVTGKESKCQSIDIKDMGVAFTVKDSKSFATIAQLFKDNGVENLDLIWEEPNMNVVPLFMKAFEEFEYTFDKYHTDDKDDENSDKKELKNINCLVAPKKVSEFKQVSEFFNKTKESVFFAKDLGNSQADDLNPDEFSNILRALAEENGFEFEEIAGDNLVEEGLTMLHGVGRGARYEPRLVMLKREVNPEADWIGLVGKGLTFDSGGLNLKPTKFIETMHLDMCGAAAVSGAMKGLNAIDCSHNVIAAFVIAENAIGPNAQKPGCIVKSFKGPTVEVDNTDAEGRLCLADGMSYIQSKYSIKAMIDVATLTGACAVALGSDAAGLFSNDKNMVRCLEKSGNASLETLWHMPIFPSHTEDIKRKGHADLHNCGKTGEAGASTAAAFLQEFVEEEVSWAHLDIAGPAFTSEGTANGFAVRSLLHFLQSYNPSDKDDISYPAQNKESWVE